MEERFILASSFGGFSTWSVGPVAFGPVVKQHIMLALCGRENVHFMANNKTL
jgi:hypothetical protein